jgi:serine/threonine protein kinase
MKTTVIQLVCPACATHVTASSPDAVALCPRCGAALEPPRAANGASAPPEPSAVEPEAADGSLIADLREAFGFDGLDARTPVTSAGARGALDVTALPPGSRLDDFEILGELGRGGMGVVYRARQISLGREVALKVLPGFARHGRTAVQRFRAEAQAAARLHHTNIVSVYAQGEYRGQYYYAMELVEGVPLDTVIRRRPDLLSSRSLRSGSSAIALWRSGASGAVRGGSSAHAGLAAPTRTAAPAPTTPPPDLPPVATPEEAAWTSADFRTLAALVAEVADALDCAHQQGIIHRDVKPHNLLLGRPAGAPPGATLDRLHLTDFGLARLVDEPHVTVAGELMGTPAYMSPEQVRAGTADAGQTTPEIDHRTDIYSLGVTLYELLTRHKAFDGRTREQIISGICTLEPPPPRRLNPRIPVDLETICLRAMNKEPAQRYPTAALLAADLRRFADGRPILSRRTSLPARAVKWMRRHKALTGALATGVAALALAAGWAVSTQIARQREGTRLLQEAYEQLAFFDYRRPELVRPQIDRAAALGAPEPDLNRARALAIVGTDPAGAARLLTKVLQHNPTDLRTRYLLAWACRLQNGPDPAAAANALAAADAQREAPGGTDHMTPDAWFFRGLALHRTDPAAALDSYRQANAMRARAHGFYPQAVLHLARARNQQLYATRSLSGFTEAEASLRQLVDQQCYGAYPYYLLSITHRLAAEIYAGSQGTRGDELVDAHYAQALAWAQRGQQFDGGDDRPITAEAECLESLGRFEEAIVARTRAIVAAQSERQRWEGYHYRWRLLYWTAATAPDEETRRTRLTAALDDLAECARQDPHSRFYAALYPALIRAELGDHDSAAGLVWRLVSDPAASAVDTVWAATGLRLLGRPAEAAALLDARAATADFTAGLEPPETEVWLRALYRFMQLGGSPDDLETLAAASPTPWRLRGAVAFHSAARDLATGARTEALAGFLGAYRSFDDEAGYTYHGRLLAVLLQKNPSWPPWIQVSWGDGMGAGPVRVPEGTRGDDGEGERQ